MSTNPAKEIHLEDWQAMVDTIYHPKKEVTIALVGKYVKLHDAYLSVIEALKHGGYENSAKVNIKWVESDLLNEENLRETFEDVQGILIPGGFGDRGIEGMILSARYARENNIPYLGLCLGMQIAVIEFARNVLGYADANSNEFDPHSEHKVIDFMENQNDEINKGGTMRLGAYPCIIKDGSLLQECYGSREISERHRHRYEFNNSYYPEFMENGMLISGSSPDGTLVEAIEYPRNDFYIGVQYHPEFKSRPNHAHPLFRNFIKHSLK